MQLKRTLMPALYRAIYLAGSRSDDGGITILSYHSLDDLGTPLSVPPLLFEAQMAVLAREGCPTFTVSEVAAHLSEQRPFPRRAMAITFDDGFANFATQGAPILASYGLKATVYVITGMVGRMTRWTDGNKPLPSLPTLTWSQIEQLAQSGIEIGAHTVHHHFLTTYGAPQLRDELAQCRDTLESRLGRPVRSFAYPQGDYNRLVVSVTRQAGFTTATTVDQGRATLRSDPFRLPRLLVSGNTSPVVMRAFTSPAIGPAYRAINFAFRRVLRKRLWPRRSPGEVQSFESVPIEPEGGGP